MSFRQKVDALSPNLTKPETEDTWDRIAKAIVSLEALFNNGLCEDPEEGQSTMRTHARPLISAMNSERTRLSGPTFNLINTVSSSLGSDFEPLLSLYLPPLLAICGRTNKVVTTRARTCILNIVENTQLPGILSHLHHNAQDKSNSLRLIVAEATLACLNCLNPPDLERETRAKDVEAIIRSAARDPSADVRKVGKQIFAAYQQVLPGRVDAFTAPLTPTTRKYLDIQSKSGNMRSISPSTSRPPSSRSMHSVHERQPERKLTTSTKSKANPTTTTTTTTGQSFKSHQRSTSALSTHPTQPSSSKASEQIGLSKSGPSRSKPEKTTMPPPDFLPVRTAATRQLTSSKSTSSLEQRSTSGPSRPDPKALSKPAVSGPFRPERLKPAELHLAKPVGTTAAERHAMPDGPRRIMLPEKPPTIDNTKVIVVEVSKAPDSAVSTSSVVAKSVPAVKPSQPAASLKRAVSRPHLAATKKSEKFKPVPTVKPSVSSKSLAKPSTSAATSTSQRDLGNVKGKGASAPTLAQAARMKPPVERKPLVKTSASTKPTWGGRPTTKGSEHAKSSAPFKPTQRKPTTKVDPVTVPLPSSPKRGKGKREGKITPVHIPLPSSPSPTPIPELPKEEDVVANEVVEADEADDEAPSDFLRHSPTPPPTATDVVDDDIPGDLKIILTGSSPCVTKEPVTPQRTHNCKTLSVKTDCTPISALLASIEEGFLFTPGPPISPPANIVARVRAAELDMPEVLGDRRDSWAETRHVLGLADDEVPFGISSVFSKNSRSREALSDVEVNQ